MPRAELWGIMANSVTSGRGFWRVGSWIFQVGWNAGFGCWWWNFLLSGAGLWDEWICLWSATIPYGYAPAAFWLNLKEGANSFNEWRVVDRCQERSYDRRYEVDIDILGDVHDPSATRDGDGNGFLASLVRRPE